MTLPRPSGPDVDALLADLRTIRQAMWALEEVGPRRGEFIAAVNRVAALARPAANTNDLLRDAGEALRAAHDPERWDDVLTAQVRDLLERIDAAVRSREQQEGT